VCAIRSFHQPEFDGGVEPKLVYPLPGTAWSGENNKSREEGVGLGEKKELNRPVSTYGMAWWVNIKLLVGRNAVKSEVGADSNLHYQNLLRYENLCQLGTPLVQILAFT
jgi:hypothetical protein